MAVSIFPGKTTRQQDFTSSGTWTCPSGVYSAEFLVVGAGGAGGGVATSTASTRRSSGGGGGGGAVKKVNLAVTPGTSYTITVGAKGTGSAGAAGGNAGYSEVLNGASVLIRAYGGAGGSGVTAADAIILRTDTATVGGGSGYATTGTGSGNAAGGGGGANGAIGINKDTAYAANALELSLAQDGGTGKISGFYGFSTVGGLGLDNYGGGGGGGVMASTASNVTAGTGSAPYGSGAGATRTTSGSTAGSAALANTGGGGGGACVYDSLTTSAGGNGSDGLVRVVYFG